MDIYLGTNDRKEVIRLPIIPSKIKIISPMKNEVFETANFGDIKLIGLEGLKNTSLESFFPNNKYIYDKNNFEYKADYYVNLIEKWKNGRIPIRLIISDTSFTFNKLMSIENFEYGVEDGTGDIYYTLSLDEFKEIKLDIKNLNYSKSVTTSVATNIKSSNNNSYGQYGIVTASVLNVRDKATTNSKIIGQLKKGQKVKIYKVHGAWYEIYFGNHGGYVSAKYIKKV